MSNIIQITKKSEQELRESGVFQWPIWTCEISEFPWEYFDRESCYLLKGIVEVTVDEKVYRFEAGDYVVFPKGLACHWKVISPVRKHYQMG